MQKIHLLMGIILFCFAVQVEGCESIYKNDILQEFNMVTFEDIDSENGYDITKINNYENMLDSSETKSRIYIKPGSIVLSNNRIYLISSNFCLPIDSIHCDVQGYYIMCTEGWLNWKCCRCKTLNSYDWNSCSRCGRQKC